MHNGQTDFYLLCGGRAVHFLVAHMHEALGFFLGFKYFLQIKDIFLKREFQVL